MNWYFKFLASILSLFFGHEILAHGGRLEAIGCHQNTKKRSFHCLDEEQFRQEFVSWNEAINTKGVSQKQFTKSLKGTVRIVDGDTIWIEDM